jgi:23S rRNA pseudouridine1911/1915/1917 synthase
MHYTGTKPNIRVIYEDNHLLVIDKPANQLSQGDHTGDPDVLSLCKMYLKKKYNKPGNVFLGLVHRLDRPVSGVMVMARTSKAASRLSEQVRQRVFDKLYYAVVEGQTPETGKLVHHLAKNNKTNKTEVHNKAKGFTKKAELKFRTLKQINKMSLVEVELITGRPHQIRAQFSREGFPLWGDVKYGGTKHNETFGLRSVELSIIHPTKKEEMTFKADLPDEQPWNIFKV